MRPSFRTFSVITGDTDRCPEDPHPLLDTTLYPRGNAEGLSFFFSFFCLQARVAPPRLLTGARRTRPHPHPRRSVAGRRLCRRSMKADVDYVVANGPDAEHMMWALATTKAAGPTSSSSSTSPPIPAKPTPSARLRSRARRQIFSTGFRAPFSPTPAWPTTGISTRAASARGATSRSPRQHPQRRRVQRRHGGGACSEDLERPLQRAVQHLHREQVSEARAYQAGARLRAHPHAAPSHRTRAGLGQGGQHLRAAHMQRRPRTHQVRQQVDP